MQKEENSASPDISEILMNAHSSSEESKRMLSKVKRSSRNKNIKKQFTNLRLPVILEWDHESSSDHDHQECLANFDPSKFLSPNIDFLDHFCDKYSKSFTLNSDKDGSKYSNDHYQKEYEENKDYIRRRTEEITKYYNLEVAQEESPAVDRKAIEKEYKRKIEFLKSLLTRLTTHRYTLSQVKIAIVDFQMPENANSYQSLYGSGSDNMSLNELLNHLNVTSFRISSEGDGSYEERSVDENSNVNAVLIRKY